MARILVIDDNEDLRALIQVILESEGFEVDLAADGAAGLASQRAAPCELIVTDIFMPDQDGLETIAMVKQEFPWVKVLAMSGGGKASHPQGYLRTALELGADAVLSKPFEQEQLVKVVRELLR